MITPNYEYVASGLNYGVNHTKDDDATEVWKKVNTWIDKLNLTNNHYVSALFNAYIEPDDGIEHRKHLTSFHNLMSDSGGLQMISLGHKTISDAAKNKIYDIQSKYSDIAMIFDEVPVVDASPANIPKELKNTESRLFDSNMFYTCAKETARNIVNQINYFSDVGSETKIMCILQGNSTIWYQRWLDIILKEVPASKHDRIGGIAFGSPAFGTGMLEDIEKYFFISKIEGPAHLLKHFHLLGVGAINRLYPVVSFRRSGLIPSDVLISYDSTKHTGGLVRGDMQIEHECLRAERKTNKNLLKQASTLKAFAENVLKEPITDIKFVHDSIIYQKSVLQEKYGNTPELSLKLTEIKFMILMCSIYNFIQAFDKCHSDETYFNTVCNSSTILSLSGVETQKEFDLWKSYAKSSIRSNKVREVYSSSLSEFF